MPFPSPVLKVKSESEVTQSCPTLSDPMDCSPTRVFCPWNSPSKNTGMGSHSLLQGIFPTQGSNLGHLHCKWILYLLSHQDEVRDVPRRMYQEEWNQPEDQGRKVKSESEVAQSCPTLCNPTDCSPPGSSTHGIFQARVLEWGAIAFSVQLPTPFYLPHSS